ESLDEARRSVLDLRAGPLERQALPAALAELAQRFAGETQIAIRADLPPISPRLPARVEEALYRIAQEALVNVRRHAQAAHVALSLQLSGSQVLLVIADDGRGFDAAQASAGTPSERRGFGLIGMQERAHMLRGTMRMHSGSGSGTRVEVAIPLE
nr:ATP-binding protein [Kouleothrix sp.]